jgi:hypothetical protein
VLPPGPGGSVRVDVDDERRLDVLRALPAPFRRRLALAMFVAAGRNPTPVGSWQQPPFGRVLTSLVVPAVARSLASSGASADRPGDDAPAGPGPSTNVDVRWTTLGPGERPRLEGQIGARGGWAHLRISPAWIAEAWARGLTHVGELLVLGVDGITGHADPNLSARRLVVRVAEWSVLDTGRSRRWQASTTGTTRTIAVPWTATSPRWSRRGHPG